MKIPVKVTTINVIDGTTITFKSVGEAADFADVARTTMSTWIRTRAMNRDGWIFFPAEGQVLQPPKKRNKKPKKKEFKNEDSDLSNTEHTIIKYEVRFGHVCITPCPFMLAPKHLVGSYSCLKCGSFRGRNRSTHEVACSRTIY